MRIRFGLAGIALFALVAAGCGGDDGGSFGDIADSDSGDSGGFGDSGDLPDDVQDLLGDVDVDEILDDIQSGEDPSDALGDLMENAEDLAESFADDGSGTIEINGDTIDFTSSICFAGFGDFTIEGGGKTSDGTPVWVSISYSEQSREEMLEFMDEEMVDLVYGDADPIIDSSVSVEYGRAEMFASGSDDQPDFRATGGGFAGPNESVDIQVSDSGAQGSGVATDNNFISGDFEDTYPFTFRAACS